MICFFFLSFLGVNVLFNFPRSPIDLNFFFFCGKPDQARPISYMLLDKHHGTLRVYSLHKHTAEQKVTRGRPGPARTYSWKTSTYMRGNKRTAQHVTERYVLSREAPLCLLSGEPEPPCIIQRCLTYTIALWIVSMHKHRPVETQKERADTLQMEIS